MTSPCLAGESAASSRLRASMLMAGGYGFGESRTNGKVKEGRNGVSRLGAFPNGVWERGEGFLLKLAEPTFIYRDVLNHCGSGSEIELLELVGELVAINKVDGWCTVPGGLLDGIA